MSLKPSRAAALLLVLLLSAGLFFFLRSDEAVRDDALVPHADGPAHSPEAESRPLAPELRSPVAPAEPALEPVVASGPAVLVDEPVEFEAPPIGVLEVIVQREVQGGTAQPFSGATLRLARSGDVFRTGAPPLLEQEKVVAERSVGADGRVLFEELEVGGWFVEATTPSGSTRHASIKLQKHEGRRLRITFGSGRVYGVVSDPETREPVQYAVVGITLQPVLPGGRRYEVQRVLSQAGRSSSSHTVTTGPDGKFEFAELTGGEASLSLDAGAYNPDTKEYRFVPARFIRFELEEGETRRFDFPDLSAAIWTGEVRSRSGERVVGEDQECSNLSVTLRGSFRYTQVQSVAQDGSFRLHLPAGTYDVRLKSPFNSESSEPFGEEGLTLMDGVETDRDLILPGTRIQGRVLDGSGRPKQFLHQTPAGAHLEGQFHDSAWFNTTLREDGTFSLEGLGPGTWVVKAGRQGAQTILTVRESDLELTATITMP